MSARFETAAQVAARSLFERRVKHCIPGNL
jgi:hypothetical protein